MGWTELEEIAARQHRFVHCDQAEDCGVPARTLRALARRRGWEQPFAGVVGLPGPATDDGRLMGADLTLPEGCAITSWSALWLHGYLKALPTKIHVLVPYGLGVPRHPLLSARRSRTFEPHEIVTIRRIRVTDLPRTLAQVAREANLSTLRGWALDARQRGELDSAELGKRAATMGAFPGCRKIDTLCRQIDEAQADSELEFAMRRKLRAVHLRPDPQQAQVPTARGTIHLDVPWSRYRVGLDCDGLAFHSSRADLDKDVRRHNSAQGTGWVIFRATWTHVDDPKAFAELVEDLRRALRRAGHPRA